MLRSTWSPVTGGFLTSGTGRAFLLHPFQSFCVLSSCYQHQWWLTCHRVKTWNTAQPISSEVVLARHSSVLGGNTETDDNRVSKQAFCCSINQNPSCLCPAWVPQPSTPPLWCVCDMAWPLSPEGPQQEQRPELLTPCCLCTFITQSQDLDISPDIWSPLESALISWNAIKYTQDESRAAQLCTEQNLGGRWGFRSRYVTHPCEAAGHVSDEVCTLAAAAAKSLQSCPTPCNPRDGSPPGSPIPGILQARTLEWVAISFSNAWKWRVKVKSATPWTAAFQVPLSMGFSRQEYWSGCHCLLRVP